MIKTYQIRCNTALNLSTAATIPNDSPFSIQKIYGNEVRIFKQVSEPTRLSENYEVLNQIIDVKSFISTSSAPIWAFSVTNDSKLALDLS